jgi:cytoskeleton protein RodZ
MTGTLPEQKADNIVAPEKPGNNESTPGVGATLREARERFGLSVADVSASIKFAPRQIEALEADDYARLPEATFLRGFVRSYAKLLNIESATLLAALPKAEKPPAPPETAMAATAVPLPTVYAERKPNIIWLAAALAVAVLLALSAWLMSDSPKEPDQQMQAGISEPGNVVVQPVEPPTPAADTAIVAAPEPKPATAPPQVKPNSAPGIIRMVFDGDSWVEVTDRDGNVLMSKINQQGTEQNINGDPPFSLVIGEAKSVHLYYQGKEVDLAPHTKIEVARLKLE